MRGALKAVALLAVLGAAVCAKADPATYHWDPGGQSTSWILAGNWDPDRGDPGGEDILYVDKSGGSTCTYDATTETVQCVYVAEGNTVQHGTGKTLTITGEPSGPVLGHALFVGYRQGNGTYTMTGGTLVVENTSPQANASVCVGYNTPPGEEWYAQNARGFFALSGGSCSFEELVITGGVPPSGTSQDVSTFTLSGGSLTVRNEHVGGVDKGRFEQSGGTHLVKSTLVLSDANGQGHYEMTGGTLTVGEEDGTGGTIVVGRSGGARFVQTGDSASTVTVKANGEDEGGLLQIGTWSGAGVYTLDWTGTAAPGNSLTVEREIKVGGRVDYDNWPGRLEWFASPEDGNISTPTLRLAAQGALAVGFDFEVSDLLDLDGQFQGIGEILDLDAGTLEVTNGATAMHAGGQELLVGRLNIGSCEIEPDGSGSYGIEGTFTGNAMTTGSLFLAPRDVGTLRVGSEEVATDATFVVTGCVSPYAGYGGLPAAVSVYLGAEGTLLVDEDSTLTLVLTAADAAFTVRAGASGEDLEGLSRTALKFTTGHQTANKTIEAAGEDGGLPDEGDFDEPGNFTLDRLVVGDGQATARVRLYVADAEDNQADGNGNEAVYVRSLTVEHRGTFGASEWGEMYGCLYYLNGGDPKRLYMGDADLDGDVDFGDYQILEANFGQTEGMSWGDADFDGDADVDFADYGILETNFGQGGRGDGGGEEGDSAFDARPLPKLMDYDDDGDVDLDDLRILQEMMKEQDGQ